MRNMFLIKCPRTGAFGYMGRDGRVLGGYKYAYASEQAGGIALAQAGDRWLLIDAHQGETCLPDELGGGADQEPMAYWDGGLIRYQSSGGWWGYFDRSGASVIAPSLYRTFGFFEGLAAAEAERDGGMGFLDHRGSWIIPPQFLVASRFSQGRAAVRRDDNFAYIDREGRLLTGFVYRWPADFAEGAAFVWQEGCLDAAGVACGGFVDMDFKPMGRQDLYLGGKFNGGMAPVAVNTGRDIVAGESRLRLKWGVLYRSGELVMTDYSYIMEASDGMMAVCRGGYMTEEGVHDGGLWGFVDDKLTSCIPCAYEAVDPFCGGLARVFRRIGTLGLDWRESWEYLDSRGRSVGPGH